MSLTMLVYACFVPSMFLGSLAWQNPDPWFDQFKETDRYLASDGQQFRMPLRLAMHTAVLYGSADLQQVGRDFQEEEFIPVSVGGKAVVSVWFNNFTDTDCGPEGRRNPYYETLFSLPVTLKSTPLSLPYETPMSYIVKDPRVLNFVYRIICGAAFNNTIAASGAVVGGREVWGFPKHHVLADIHYDYDGHLIRFSAVHQGQPVVSMRMQLPETADDVVTLRQEVQTPKDASVTPRWTVKQTRYGKAFNATMHIARWQNSTDHFIVHSRGGQYGSVLSRWHFQPAVKMHAIDFKLVAFKSAGWLGAPTCR